MGAYNHLKRLGYDIEEFNLDNLPLEQPYYQKEGQVFFLVKKEDLDEKVHKEIIEEEKWELKEIVNYKLKASQKAHRNISLYNSIIHWLELNFGNTQNTKYMDEEKVKKNEQLCDDYQKCEGLCEKNALRYAIIIKENGDTYFILRKTKERERTFKNYLQMAEMTGQNPMDWVRKNADKFRKILGECIVHGKKQDEHYISYHNLEEKLEEAGVC